MPTNYRLNYRSSGVDVDAGDKLVEWLQSDLQSAKKPQIHQDKILSGIGGFAALFKLDFPEIKKPLLVSSTDGVGTKVKLAADFDRLEGIGQDLVAMCVNDLITTGATPLFFLDYYATGKLNLSQAQKFLRGLQKACHEARIALIGGETAEMPGVYSGNDFDCAGFAVGIVDQEKMRGAHRVKPGDVVLGISSSGFHSNGYSLLRRVFEKDMDKWADQLLIPTHLYTDLVVELGQNVNAFANITGGGVDNLPRVIPPECSVRLHSWKWPEIFQEVQRRAEMSDQEMLRTLNCGIGFAVFCEAKQIQRVQEVAVKMGYEVQKIGEVVDQKAQDQLIWP